MYMHALLLTLHIVALSLSIVATVTMTILALFSKATPKNVQRLNLAITSIGIALGTILLIQNPIGSRCVELSAYLVVFAFAYRFVANRSHALTLNLAREV